MDAHEPPEAGPVTLHCLVVDPPRPGLALPGLLDGPLEASGAATLAEAAIADTMVAAERSGGELLVNFPDADRLPDAQQTGTTPEAALRALAENVLASPDEARFEVQVGSTFAARAGNAASHLLRESGEASVAIMDATAPTLGRTALDGAAMKLRRNPVVMVPGSGGHVPYLGLTEPIDFAGAYAAPAVEDLTRRGVDADLAVEFVGHHPTIADASGLASVVATVRARRAAGRPVPEHTAAAIDQLGLRVADRGGVTGLTTDSS